MYISCNQLKKYIKNADKLNFEELWNEFTIKSAEIDSIIYKGKDISRVVVAEVIEIKKHPTIEKYNIVKMNIGNNKEIISVTSATNVYKNMKVPCALEGGSLKNISNVIKTDINGTISEGVLASEKELGISDLHEGVMDLDASYKVGEDIKKYIPIDDVIIEIDNKSLTNRPDMWGHLGIARELKAIHGLELLDLEVENIENNKNKDIKLKIEDIENCNRYSAIELENITKKEALIDMKVMLYYCGMRSISLLVDLTNYIMLELGQPLHAFDANKINGIVVKNTKEETLKFKTLDSEERTIPKNTLMIYSDDVPVAIAGIMGGETAEVEKNTDSIILESANFNGTCVRKSATTMGLRTEAVARYEKQIDPNMTVMAIKRFVKLLKEVDENVLISSNIADEYINVNAEKEVVLKKSYLEKYMGFILKDEEVKNILESLDFKISVKDDSYLIYPPTYRTTKDITCAADVIEEIARIYGYNNLIPEPLKLDLVINKAGGEYNEEYSIKNFLASVYKASEIHTYLWHQKDLLNKLCLTDEEGLYIVNKKENNYLRSDLNISILQACFQNSKNIQEYKIFEIGSEFFNKEEKRMLSYANVCNQKEIEKNYLNTKQLIYDLFKSLKNLEISFIKAEQNNGYLNNEYTLNVVLNKEVLGYISIVDKNISKNINKKSEIILLKLDVEKFHSLNDKKILYKEVSKYPLTTIDYTIISDLNESHEKLNNIFKNITNKHLKGYFLKDIYLDEMKKTTIRFEIESFEQTLNNEDINFFREEVEKIILENKFDFVGRK